MLAQYLQAERSRLQSLGSLNTIPDFLCQDFHRAARLRQHHGDSDLFCNYQASRELVKPLGHDRLFLLYYLCICNTTERIKINKQY